MLLYHYTSHSRLPAILATGLSRGEAPISDSEWVTAVNLTTDSSPTGHGLDNAGHVWTADECAKVLLATGQWIEPGSISENKRAVRITVKVMAADRKLKDWLPWARKRLQPDYLARLHAAAGEGGRKASTWRLYFGVIPSSAFVAVDHLEPPPADDTQMIHGA